MRGRLIVIEGLDGSGKATQTARVFEYLKSAADNCKRLSFPDYDSPSSSLVKMYLSGELSPSPDGVNAYAASAFYAVDRYASFVKNWKSDYDSGTVFAADRYYTSNAVYQMGKLPYDEWDDYLLWLEDFESNKLQIPKPDCVIYLDMSVEVSQKLMSLRYNNDESRKDIHERDIEFLKSCRRSALYAAKKLGWNIVSCDDGLAPRTVDDIFNDICRIINAHDLIKC